MKPSGTIHEALGKKGALPSGIRPLSPAMKLCGTAFTIQAMPGDNLLLHRLIANAAVGEVLVAEVSGFYEAGYWGAILPVVSLARGLAGLVAGGCVRDAGELEALGFPAFSRGLCIRGTTKHGTSQIEEPIIIGDVPIAPGDAVVGDRDGLVVAPDGPVEMVIANCQAREEKEQCTMPCSPGPAIIK